MAQLVLGVVGAAIGFYVGGPAGAQVGFVAGSAIGAVAFRPEVDIPKVADLKAPQVQYGTTIPRLYGCNRTSGTLAWYSAKRVIPGDSGGKGTPTAPTADTAEIDVLYILAADSDMIGVARIWKNGQLVWTMHAGSGDASLSASAEADAWSEIRFLDGNPAQLPDPTIETAEGVGNAPAYRHRQCIMIVGLKLWQSGQMPLLEFEVVTSGTIADATTNAAKILEYYAPTQLHSRGASLGEDLTTNVTGITPTTLDVDGNVIMGGVKTFGTASATVAIPPNTQLVLGRGNGDRAILVFGAVDGSAAGFGMAGDGITRYVDLEDPTDYLGAADIRFAVRSGRLAIGSAAAIGTGAAVYGDLVVEGAKGKLYLYGVEDGSYVSSVTIGVPIESIAMSSRLVWALAGSLIHQFVISGGLVADGTLSLPDGTGHSLTCTPAGVLYSINSAQEVHKLTDDSGWTLVTTLVADDSASLAPSATTHYSVIGSSMYAIVGVQKTGVISNTFPFVWSWDNENDPAAYFEDLVSCINSRGFAAFVALWNSGELGQTLSNAIWQIVSTEAVSSGLWALGYRYAITVVNSGMLNEWTTNAWGYPTYQSFPISGTDTYYSFDWGPHEISELSHNVYKQALVRVVDPGTVDLSDIVTAEWQRVDDAAKIDVTDLVGIPVRGFQSAGSVRGAYEALAPVFHFGAVASDKLYFRLQGGASAATIAFDDLAAGENVSSGEPFAPQRANDEEFAERILLTYPNISDDYASGTETGSRGSSSTIVLAQQSNVVMNPAEAKAVAETSAAQAGIATTTAQISLTDYYVSLEPTDSITVPDEDGSTVRMRIMRETYGGGVRQLDLVRDDVTTLTAQGLTSSGWYAQSFTVTAPTATEIVLLDTAILRDTNDDPGFYVAANGFAGGGAKLYSSGDNVTYAEELSLPSQSVFGSCLSEIGSWSGGRVFDECNTVTVDVRDGTLSSTTRAEMLHDQSVNACAIGVHGCWELTQFRTATLVSTGVYTLSGFLRGSRGTEWACTRHTGGETFVLLTTAARRVDMQTSELGVTKYYKGVSSGKLVSSAASVALADNAEGLHPYAPVHVRVARDASNNATISFTRRSRFSTRFASSLGIVCPLGEASESYAADVYADFLYSAVLRTITASSSSMSYSAAQQTADGLTPGAPIFLRIYQLNQIVGRGYAAEISA